MRKTIHLMVILALGTGLLGCVGSSIDRGPALKFLQGVQENDKNKMYQAANLTTEDVNDSRAKLIHATQDKVTNQQRMDAEHALRISGEIDFFSIKLKKMLPPSALFQITRTNEKSPTDGTTHAVLDVRITYGNQAEALTDKTGRHIKEMDVHLQQATRTIQGRLMHEFSFNSQDFEKIADRNFEVSSYFD